MLQAAFSTASSDSAAFVTCAQREPALVREENSATSKSGKCQSGCVVQGMKPVHVCPTGGHFAGLRPPVPREQIAVLQPSKHLLVYSPVFWTLLHSLDTMLDDTTNPPATVHIDGPWWRCCITRTTSVGQRCCYIMLPSSESTGKENCSESMTREKCLLALPAKPFFTAVAS